MKKLIFTLLLIPWIQWSFAQNPVDPSAAHSLLKFTENKGQWHDLAYFKALLNYGDLYVEKHQLTFDLFHPEDIDAFHSHQHSQFTNPTTLRKHAYQMEFVQANPDVLIRPELLFDDVKNYILGKDPKKWVKNARSFGRIHYYDLWEKVDMRIFQKGPHFKYEFIVESGAQINDIQIRYNGLNSIKLIDDELILNTSVNKIVEKDVYAYQIIENKKVDIPCHFKLNGQVVTFAFPNGYDSTETLIIDPVLTFSTYTGSRADNFGFTATYDDQGNLYAGGIVFAQGYPVTSGAYQTSFSSAVDMGITKFNSTGTGLVYSTYIGGSDVETPNSLVVNSNGELIILGNTSSLDYPTSSTAYDQNFNGGTGINFPSNGTNFLNGTDIVLTVLNDQGNSLVGSTYLGGSENDGLNTGINNNSILNFNYSDLFRGEVVVDDADNIYVASTTQSTDFPASANAIYSSSQGAQDAVVAKFDKTLSSLIWSTYLGGSDDDSGYSLKLDSSGNVYVTGGTTSSDFPTTTGVVHTSTPGGSADGYIAWIEDGTKLHAATYIGTNGYDQSFFVEIDHDHDIYIVGQTDGNYPVSAGVYSNTNGGQFISKLNPGLSTFHFSTRFGKGDGDPELVPTAFLVDLCKNIYVSGWGGGTNNFSNNADIDLTGMPLTANAFQSNTDGSDFYYFVVSRNAASLKYATYFGGNNSQDHVDGGTSRFDKHGIIYQSVCASCGSSNSDFPTTPGAYSNIDSSIVPQPNCNLAALKFEFQLAFVEAVADASPVTSGCSPLEVQFENKGTPGIDYLWQFGDGNTSDDENPVYTFNNPGQYQVTFIALDSSECNSSDTAQITVNVYPNATASFDASPDLVNPGTEIQFTNNSAGSDSYRWDFGDGNTSQEENPSHSFKAAGTYIVCLWAKNDQGCDDSICQEIKVSELALIDVPNAFSPNGDNVNDVLYVRGYGVEQLTFKVFNRWGELVFETHDLNNGWDGVYKGEPQEMDVFVYSLEARLENGRKVSQSGDITLIR